MKRLIVINGIIGSGKTKAAEKLIEEHGLVSRQCKDRIHELTISLFDVEEWQYWEAYLSRDLKEKPLPLFPVSHTGYNKLMGRLHPDEPHRLLTGEGMTMLSCRQAMIYTSDIVAKPTFGDDYFGRHRIDSMSDNEIAIDDSAGFTEELYPAIKQLGQENILLIKVSGFGDMGEDSRELIPHGVIDNTVDLVNDGSLEEWLEKVNRAVNDFLSYQPSLSP